MRVSLTTWLAPAAVSLALAPTATANYESPDYVPDLPGIGEPTGVLGSMPEIEILTSAARLRPGGVISISARCTTSTEAGCSGLLELGGSDGSELGVASFDLYEGEVRALHFTLPPATRSAARDRTLVLRAEASGVDSLGRLASDTRQIKVRSSRRTK